MRMDEPQNLRAEHNLNERAFRVAVAGATAFNTDPTDFCQGPPLYSAISNLVALATARANGRFGCEGLNRAALFCQILIGCMVASWLIPCVIVAGPSAGLREHQYE